MSGGARVSPGDSLLDTNERRPELVIDDDKRDLLACTTDYVQVHEGDEARRLHRGVPRVAKYLGFTLEDIDEAEVERMFVATENHAPGTHSFSAFGLRRHFFATPGFYPSDIEPSDIWRVRDRFGNVIFVALLGKTVSRDPDIVGRVFWRVQAIAVEQAKSWENVYPDVPGAGAFVTMLGAYAHRIRRVPPLGRSKIERDGFIVGNNFSKSMREHYSELGWLMSCKKRPPAIGSEECSRHWWTCVTRGRFYKTVMYLQWFDEDVPSREEDLSDAIRKMSDGLVVAPDGDAPVDECKRFFYEADALAKVWSCIGRELKRAENDHGMGVGIIPEERTMQEFFRDEGGRDMLLAIFDGVPADDVLA